MKILSKAQHAAPVAILSYCGASILMTVTNKLVLSSYDFKLNFLLLTIQSVVTILLLEICAGFGLLKHRPFRISEAKNWFAVSLSLVLMIYTGSKALQFLSIPVFTIFKNLTIILTAYAERFILKGAAVTHLMLVSFALIVLSSIVAGWADISAGAALKDNQVSATVAYGWMAMNCLTTSAFTLLMKGKLKASGFKDFDTVFYNNLLSIPTLVLFSLINELPEATRLYERYYGAESDQYASEFYGLSAGILVSSVAAFAISYSTSWCVRVTSSTTYSMAGALNKLPIAISGMIFFDAVVNVFSILGVFLAFAGGIVYSISKTQQAASLLDTSDSEVSLPLHKDIDTQDDSEK
ncbi:hypothetical protein BASA50_000264 [Batrachochytrium salamandrivorans]|uniref:GDP-mannose transporter n=1 Tax=Batrachochytrium salamandrivorans TaxID=1357716 RepID=A0ABQ8EV87_9FUNG|nr:hypothetical protein BASA62_009957 [Batrachochytrium salamandrivorans]KAH6584309.1 hypothetical protein BASA60_001044 [Batrachochytrium salamandrivorans]KAH6586900.1 hypothetical protein BASA50_000264 [Batrachochytrium salamandrivorans]KAH9274631.1 hypothetical protein BASA83_002816 [Batrachochytrium salamandrivorans]KAJ1342215.1 hypothetical protein BSLG_003138 [Batrachochytrium salamandrivorans]